MSFKKVILNYDEYLRLKSIEKDYETLSKEYQELKKVKKTDHEQSGSGLYSNLHSDQIRKIVDIVKQEISLPPQPVVTTWQNYERTEPRTAMVGHPKPSSLNMFNVVYSKSHQNDIYDEKKLMKRVPKEHRVVAKRLLDAIDSRPNEMNFNSEGVIFVDDESIPSSNIYKFFPLLFKKKAPKNFTGFKDFISKLQEMGLGHFIQYPIDHKTAVKLDKAVEDATQITSDDQWWFIG